MAEVKGQPKSQGQRKARLYRLANAVTGMCYAFVKYAEGELRKKGSSEEEIKREVKKLIEKVDQSSHFGYTAAPLMDSAFARLYRSSDTYFCYDEVKNLLKEMGIERQEEGEEGGRYLSLSLQDLEKARVYLLENELASPRDWRQFVYEVRLLLYTHFPNYIKPDREETRR